MKNTANTESLLYPHTYPPRFIIEVSAREMENSEFMTLKFTGPKNPIKVTIQLQVQSKLGKCSISIINHTLLNTFRAVISTLILVRIWPVIARAIASTIRPYEYK